MPSEARHPRDGAEQGPRSIGPRIVHAWSALDHDRRLAAIAAVLLFATMLLPWYQQNAIVSASKTAPLVSQNLNAFAVFSFIEAAVLLVALAVLFLLYQRADGRTFNLPGGDGTVIFAAGIWVVLLLVLRLFDKPGITHNGVAANVGIQWGIFFALAAAGLLAYAGSRMRAARRPEPPLMRPRPRGAADRDPAADATVAQHASEDVTVAFPSRERRARSTAAPQERSTAIAAQKRPPYPPAPLKPRPGVATPASADQLSFEDAPPHDR